tara:strand:- start:6390 stop:7205 length:816 start_codon:yes stop_codon:yes gene_type:complete
MKNILTSILFFAFSANSFFFSKTKQFRKEIGGVNIDVYEARDKKKSMLFFSGGFGKIPHFIYSDFLNRLSEKGISCYSIAGGDLTGEAFSWIEDHSNYTPFIAAHSSGAVPALDTALIAPVSEIILLDPVGFKNYNLKRVERILFLKAELSYEWKTNLDIPFIPAFGIDENNFKNSNINFTTSSSANFGHGDILDNFWADVSANTQIIKGNPERSQIVNEEYHDWIVNQIYEFTFNKPEDCKEDCEDDCNGDCEDENNNENNSEENEVVNV